MNNTPPFSWKAFLERRLARRLKRAKCVCDKPENKVRHPNEFRAAQKNDYTEMKIRIKKEIEDYDKMIDSRIERKGGKTLG